MINLPESVTTCGHCRAFNNNQGPIVSDWSMSTWEITVFCHIDLKTGDTRTVFRVVNHPMGTNEITLYVANSFIELQDWLEQHPELLTDENYICH